VKTEGWVTPKRTGEVRLPGETGLQRPLRGEKLEREVEPLEVDRD
jgi:hypothetical protein